MPDGRAGRLFQRLRARNRARRPLPLPSRRRRDPLSRSRLPLPARGAARALGGRRSLRVPVVGRGLARRRRSPARSSTRCMSAPSRRDGTWRAAAERLPWLKDIGITLIEMMPVNEFPGDFGWGYDGVDLFAPTRLYGRPDDLRRFVDAAHGLGIGVILDVVYNHFGPDGNYVALLLATAISPTPTRTSGATRSISTGRTPGRCANSSPPTPPIGSTSSTSTGCASTPRSRSMTARTEHIIAAMTRARSRCRRRTVDRRHRRERAAAREASASARGRRLRPRRALERRLPPLGDGRGDRAQRGLLRGPPRHPAGAHRRGKARLPVPGPVLRPSGQASRHARPRPAAAPRSSPSCRTTTRSRIRHEARGCTS